MVAVLEPLDQRALCGTGTASMAPAFAQRADGAAKGPARQAPCHDEERNWLPHAPIITHPLIDHVPTCPPAVGPVYKSSRWMCGGGGRKERERESDRKRD